MDELQTLVDNYRMPPEAVQLLTEHPPLIICGVTGAGKDTIARYLMQSGNYAHVVSHTSRSPRPHMDGHEVNGVDYWFIDNATAAEMITAQAFVEAKLVHGKETLYGTSIEAYHRVVENGKQPILEIDIQGVQELQREVPGLMAIFLVPPDFKTWQDRLGGRGAMHQEELRKRLKSAVIEFETFQKSENFTPIINTEVIDTARSIENGTYKDKQSTVDARVAVGHLLKDTRALLAS
jgi:guanylate kinase